MTKLIEQVHIIENHQVASDIYRCRIQTKKIAKLCLPGNFVNISVGKNNQFLLKRPFGVHNVVGNQLDILYRNRGKGTDLMTTFKQGDSLELLGPLGNEFTIFENKRVLILGGGMGIAPLVYLENNLSNKNYVKTMYAVKTREELVNINVSDLIVHVDKEEGCFACEKLEEVLVNNKIDVLFVCGPEVFIQLSYQIAKKHGIHTEVSLEARMACGFGACVGCVVETVNGLKKVCSDGPVFNAKEVWG